MIKETMPAAFIRALPAWVSHPLISFDVDGDVCLEWFSSLVSHESFADLSIVVGLEGLVAFAWTQNGSRGHGKVFFTDHGIPKELEDVFYRMRELIGVRP